MYAVGKVYVPQFDEELHAYTNSSGQKLPSVTSILSPISDALYRFIPRETLKKAAELGTAVHECIELSLQDDLDEDSVLPLWVPYLCAFRSFMGAYKPKVIATEQRLACDLYAGTIDFVCEINGELWVIDWKTTNQLMPQVALQTAAYELLARGYHGTQLMRRGAVQLKDDGTFKFEQYTDIKDYEHFETFLKARQWMDANNV